MNRWKLAVPVVACLASAFVVGCVDAAPPPAAPGPGVAVAPAAPPQEVIVQQAPPTVEQVEVVPQAPSAEYVWIRGNWHWNGVQWVWRRGHYELRRVGWRWVPAHYEQRGPNWVYVDGHWGR
jgi:hypothetical protein